MSTTHGNSTPDLRKLRHALTLARCGSYVKASASLHITQSALTRSVQALEAQYGLTLFDRGRGGVLPTASGRLLLERAEKILLAASGLERDLRLINEHGWGKVAFGIGPLPARVLLSRLLTDMNTQHPEIQLRCEVNGARYLLEHLQDESIEFFVCARGQVVEANHLHIEPLARLPLAILVRGGHALAGMSNISAAHMKPYALVSGNFPSTASGPDLSQSGRVSWPWPPMICCDDFEALRQVTLSSDVLWLTSPMMVKPDLEAATLVQLPLRPGPRHAEQILVSLDGRSVSPTAQLVIDQIAQLLTPA